MSVKSVYNFVPAPSENEVFKPDWADKVSHDIPFEDGESGEIEIKIIAKTPIFIRNGHSKKDAEDNTERYQDFSNVVRNGVKEYFIPGSSLKGMFRNVMEIMSFSRMRQISDDRYSFRDLTRNSLYMNSYKSNEVVGGWLIQNSKGDWTIEECEELAFIHHKELEKKDIPFRDLFLNKQPKEKIAAYKYKLVDDELLDAKFSTYTKELFGNVTRQMAKYDDNGKSGTLVFSGQSSKRKEDTAKDGKLKASGKTHEFVFFSAGNPNILPVNKKMKKDFKFIYLDHDKQNISKDWKFWRDKLEEGKKVPVFFNKKNKNEVKHFGLAYMYKLPFEQSIHETLPFKEYGKGTKDMAELIFGSIDNNETSLKGRVSVSHSFSHNAIEGELQKEILAEPKASYFPFYLSQDENVRGYKTYMNQDAELRGYKRYPIQNKSTEGNYDYKQLENDRIFSFFKPLVSKSMFTSKVRFHNLKKGEIGALLSAITFHGNESKSFHSVGGAKPYGYGQIRVSELVLKGLNYSKEDYLAEFEKIMGGVEWINSPQLLELITMAQTSDTSLEYPVEPKTFVEYKNKEESLKKYSAIVDKASSIQSIVKQVELKSNSGDFSFNSTRFNDLKDHIKELGFIEVPEYLHPNLKKAIMEIYENHKASMRKLNKPFDNSYEWHSTITIWVGSETAQQWYSEITNK